MGTRKKTLNIDMDNMNVDFKSGIERLSTRTATLCLMAVASVTAWADSITISRFGYSGPYTATAPIMLDETDYNGDKYDDNPLSIQMNYDMTESWSVVSDTLMPTASAPSAHLLGFNLDVKTATRLTIDIESDLDNKLYMDNKETLCNNMFVTPGTHTFVIKYATASDEKKTMHVKATSSIDGAIEVVGREKMYTIYNVLHAKSVRAIRISPDGLYAITYYTATNDNGRTRYYQQLSETATGKTLAETDTYIRWMPRSNKYYYTQKTANGNGLDIIAVDPSNNSRTTFASDVPSDGSFNISPNEESLIYSLETEGTLADEEVYEIKDPEDRQQGYRDRSYPAIYDLKTRKMQQLVFSKNNVYMFGMSNDSRTAVFGRDKQRFEKRPTSLYDIYILDMTTMNAEKIISDDGFISNVKISPDGKKLLITGSPECLGGIGMNVKEGQTPNTFDTQIYIMDIASRKIEPMTKTFNPNVEEANWSEYDGKIYFTAEDRDCIKLFRLDPATGKIERLTTEEDIVSTYSLAKTKPVLAYSGESASNSDRTYIYNTKNKKSRLLEDVSSDNLKDIALGKCIEWNFVNSKGDTINGRYYLPPHFDPEKKYPLIVNYYGGCSPTSRNFETRYPQHAYAALGYIVYVVNPSGATGFGQEFSARHVNTAGEGPAEDIIEGTQKFCQEHPFVNDKKIGCIGASYGGFMTQYLQTKTDIFAAAISHAGISDHTSYWGEGNWGYSYSETSMANNYPWTNTKLYVDQSPLYNADKIKTPILFLHGTVDDNVPIGESIQMFTALKLLGIETAFVAVEGQDHHITDYSKRIKWHNTIMAWFAKWLKDDASWWTEMYK